MTALRPLAIVLLQLGPPLVSKMMPLHRAGHGMVIAAFAVVSFLLLLPAVVVAAPMTTMNSGQRLNNTTVVAAPSRRRPPCTHHGSCHDDFGAHWDLTALAGRQEVSGPQPNPGYTYTYAFSLFHNVALPPICAEAANLTEGVSAARFDSQGEGADACLGLGPDMAEADPSYTLRRLPADGGLLLTYTRYTASRDAPQNRKVEEDEGEEEEQEDMAERRQPARVATRATATAAVTLAIELRCNRAAGDGSPRAMQAGSPTSFYAIWDTMRSCQSRRCSAQSDCPTHEYCDSVGSCYRCSYIEPGAGGCDAMGGDCCTPAFRAQCPSNPAQCPPVGAV